MIEQKVATEGIKMSIGSESILVTKEEIIVLPIVEPRIVEGVHVDVKMKYNEP